MKALSSTSTRTISSSPKLHSEASSTILQRASTCSCHAMQQLLSTQHRPPATNLSHESSLASRQRQLRRLLLEAQNRKMGGSALLVKIEETRCGPTYLRLQGSPILLVGKKKEYLISLSNEFNQQPPKTANQPVFPMILRHLPETAAAVLPVAKRPAILAHPLLSCSETSLTSSLSSSAVQGFEYPVNVTKIGSFVSSAFQMRFKKPKT